MCKKMSNKKKNLTYGIFFPPTWLKNPCQDSWTEELSECCLKGTFNYIETLLPPGSMAAIFPLVTLLCLLS